MIDILVAFAVGMLCMAVAVAVIVPIAMLRAEIEAFENIIQLVMRLRGIAKGLHPEIRDHMQDEVFVGLLRRVASA